MVMDMDEDGLCLQEQLETTREERDKLRVRYRSLHQRYTELRAVFIHPSRFYPEEIREFRKKLVRGERKKQSG